MTPAASLVAEIDAFAAIVANLTAIAARSDPGRRSELVKLRKQLSEQIRQLRDVGARAFPDPGVANEFRSRLSTVLNVVALHQADWPAVSIDEGNAAYRRSAAGAGASNQGFIDWTRAALARVG